MQIKYYHKWNENQTAVLCILYNIFNQLPEKSALISCCIKVIFDVPYITEKIVNTKITNIKNGGKGGQCIIQHDREGVQQQYVFQAIRKLALWQQVQDAFIPFVAAENQQREQILQKVKTLISNAAQNPPNHVQDMRNFLRNEPKMMLIQRELTELVEIRQEIDDIRQERDDFEQQCEDMEQQRDDFEQQFEDLESYCEDLEQEYDKMKQERDKMKQERDDTESYCEDLEQEYDKMKQERDKMKQERDDMEDERDALQDAYKLDINQLVRFNLIDNKYNFSDAQQYCNDQLQKASNQNYFSQTQINSQQYPTTDTDEEKKDE
ncbi:Conserved hypothetical protein function [Hexamita inflata]|uniref:Uncharacterized protein n=1 Tax=Hexamita inflata TaxID=28002 RepID=A0AA86QWV2_9EUKA|nr:Conserved hypothetical protein function [Hexamita inflata]